MPKTHINVGGDWKEVTAPHVFVTSVWKAVTRTYIRVGGAWKKVFDLATITLTNLNISTSDFGPGANDCESGVRVNADGTLDNKRNRQQSGVIYTPKNPSTDWIIPNSLNVRGFYIRATEFSFVANQDAIQLFTTRNGTMGSWLTLGNGVSREWSLDVGSNNIGAGNSTWVIDLEIANDAAGLDIVAIGRFTMSGEVG